MPSWASDPEPSSRAVCTEGGGQGSEVLTFPRVARGPSFGHVPSYLVETYLPRGRAAELGACEARAKAVAQELTREGTYVHFDRSIHLPEDETCFFVLDAASSRVATLVAE